MPSAQSERLNRRGAGVAFWFLALVALPWAALSALVVGLTLIDVEAPGIAEGVACLVLVGAVSAWLLV